jgi:hypothetical protein
MCIIFAYIIGSAVQVVVHNANILQVSMCVSYAVTACQ